MIVNINYSGVINESINHLKFNSWKPKQYVHKYIDYTIVIFQTKKCRIMGCKKPLVYDSLPYKIDNIKLQSLTITSNVGQTVNLYKISMKLGMQVSYEPELFPALRLLKFNPLCVNLFSSGKIVILGIKSLKYDYILLEIQNYIKQSISDMP